MFLGLLFLFFGIAIGKFKWYWLISGYNTASKKDKQKIDIENIGKSLTKMSYMVAIVNLFGAFLVFFFKISILIFVFLTLVIIFYFVWHVQKFDRSSNSKTGKIILIVVMIIILLINVPLFSMTYKTTNVEFTKDSLRIIGTYGRTIPKENINEIKLVDNIPEIKMRTNGIGLGKIQKGNFKLDGINKGVLFLENDNGPYIQISTNIYTVFINYKYDSKTLELFNELENEFKLK
ncbi:MAG: DUF3784 domain-containing protein [Clostridium sp.]